MRKNLLFLFIFLIISFLGYSQDFSNKGRDFYVCFPQHVPSNSPSKLSIWITSDQPSSGTITMANGAFSSTFNIAANGLAEIDVPKNTTTYITNAESSNGASNQILKKSIRIKVNAGQPPVVAYVQQYGAARSAASLLLPANVLGKKYYTISYTQRGSDNGSDFARSQFQVIATQDNTIITITPRKNGVLGSPFNVTLPLAGDMIQYQSNDPGATGAVAQDLTGTFIESIATGAGGCLPIAVFSGSSNLAIGTQTPNCNGGSFDPLFQQLYPINTWGKNFGLIPFANYPRGIPYRIMASEDNTSISVNGVFVAILNKGDIYPNTFTSTPATVSNPTSITADKPICVAEYEQSSGCAGNTAPGNNQGDPDMVILNPIEQNISDITIFSTKQQVINSQWVNILIKTGGIPTFKIARNGGILAAPTGTWQTFGASLPGYSFLKQQLSVPGTGPNPISDSYRMVSDSGFNAIAYGQGDNESYAYSAGTNVRDFNQSLEIQSQYGIITSGAYSCSNSPFNFNIFLPDSALSNAGATAGTNQLVRFDSMKWSVTGSTAFAPNNFPLIINGTQPLLFPPDPSLKVVPDSTSIRNGKKVAWYSLPSAYSINTPGVYTISVTGYRTNNNDGCASGNETEFTFTLTVAGPPPAAFTFNQPGCPADSIRFLETTPQTPYPTYRFWWSIYDPANGSTVISTVRNPVRAFNTAGQKTIRFANITTPGCLSDTTTDFVTIPNLVNITLIGTTTLCQNDAQPNINFTITDGLPPYKISYTLSTNGGAAVIQTPIITSTLSNTLSIPTGTAGIYTYNITSIENANAAFCTRSITGQTATVTVNPLPTATIAGTINICQNASPPNITFTATGGSTPTSIYQFTYIPSVNGVAAAAQTINSNTAGIATISIPTIMIGTYSFDLISVSDVATTCIKTLTTGATTTATVFVQATPTGTITSTNAIVCQDAVTPPTIVFTGSGANGQAPYTFTYTITTNNVVGPIQTISTTSTSNGTTPITVSLASAGTFIYTLLTIQNSGVTNCTNTYSAAAAPTATVIINPIPTANLTGTITVCQNTGTRPITFTGVGGTGSSYDFSYTLNGVAQPILTGNNIIINQPTTTFGVYTYIITSVKDNATGCTKTYTTASPTAVVIVKELATATIATNAATVCQATTTLPVITFTAINGLAPYKFNYTITTNGVTGAVQTTPFTPFGNSYQLTLPTTTPGTYIYTLVSVQESSSAVCVNPQTSSTQVIVHPKPTASFTTVGPYCTHKTVLINPTFGITPTGSVVSWVWDYGDGTGLHIRTDGNPFTLTYPTAGVKTITFYTVSDNGCLSNVYTQPITIFSKPKAGFINPAACLADALAQFTDTSAVVGVGASIVFWEWDFGDGSPIYSGSTLAYKNPAHAYAAVGQKTVTLIVTTNSGCKDTVTQQFFINGEVTRAAFTTLNAASLCSNRPVQIQENSLVNVGGLIRTDIYWDYLGTPIVFNQDNLPTLNKIYTHNYPNLQIDKVYKVRYFAYSGFNGVCQKDTLIDVLVHASPVATFISVPDVCLNGGPVTLTQGTASGGTAVYTGPGVTFAGGVYTFNPLAMGVVLGTNNSVVYTVTSPSGCDSAKVQQIKVLDPPVVNTFTTVGNLCHNNNITFHNTYTNGDGTVVKWIYNWNDGSPLQTMTTGADVTHVYITTGWHTATITLETGYGCRNIPVPVTFTVNPLPVPMYTPSISVCLPSADVLFTNTTANVANNTYQWSFELPSTSAANTSTFTSPNHIYTTQGPFNTHLIATNITTGCVDSTLVKEINSNIIKPEPVIQFNAIPDVCLNNGTVSFAALASETSGIAGGPGIFSCLATPNAITAGGIFNPTIAGVGQHIITYTWTSSFNCPASKPKTVNVLAPPLVNTFTTIGNKCETESVTFHNTTTAGAGTIITWVYDWGDGTPNAFYANGNDVTHTYTLPGTYIATLYVITDGALCKSSPAFPLSVVVNPLPVPDFKYSDTTCLPQASVLFKNNTFNINDWDYKWNFDFPSTLSSDQSTQATDVTHIYTDITTPPHVVKLTAKSLTTGCTRFITKPITTIHPAPLASFNFNKTSVCLAQDVTVLDNSTFADGSPLTWSWNFGESSSNATGKIQPPYIYSTAKTFNVKLTVTNSFGCTDDTVRAFTVYPYPIVYAGPDDYVLEGGSIPLVPVVSGNIISYLWTAIPSPTYLNSDIILKPISTPLVDVTYKLTATGQGNCSKSDSVFIKVLRFPEIPNTFTPNNDGIHDFWEIKYLYTYPANRVQVFTRTGQLVFESKGYTKPWNGTMNGKSLPFDTYYYIIEPGSGRKPITGYVTIVK